MTRAKICGLSREADIECVNRLLPEYVGFVFAQKSRRYVSPQRALELREALDGRILAVGVFVNEPIENVASIVRSRAIDLVQLHGSEDEAYIAALREKTAAPIIKAFKVACREDVEEARRSSAELILLDNGAGGTGESFDWSLVSDVGRPWLLAGGLSPENVREAIEKCAPYGVDVSSGVETDGIKDVLKIERFLSAVRKD